MGTYIGIFSIVLLALVAGLLMVVGMWLYEFRTNSKKMTLLGDDLGRQLMSARDALAMLQKAAKESGPELSKQVTDAHKLTQDLRFLMARAEEVAQAIEQRNTVPAPANPNLVDVTPKPDNARIVAENVVAVASVDAVNLKDPLEELLAGLGPTQTPVKARTTPALADDMAPTSETPVRVASTAEVELRRKLAQ